MNILVVDDVTINRIAVERALAAEGYDVVGATNGQEALDVLDKEPIDAVVCDLLMPDMDGVEVYRQYLRRSAQTRKSTKIPFILPTAAQNIERLKIVRNMGFTDVLTKPLDFDRLKVILSEIENNQTQSSTSMQMNVDICIKTVEDLTAAIVAAHDAESAKGLSRALNQINLRLQKIAS